MEFYQDGSYSNALWSNKMGANDAATNFLWDFYVQLDSASVDAGRPSNMTLSSSWAATTT